MERKKNSVCLGKKVTGRTTLSPIVLDASGPRGGYLAKEVLKKWIMVWLGRWRGDQMWEFSGCCSAMVGFVW